MTHNGPHDHESHHLTISETNQHSTKTVTSKSEDGGTTKHHRRKISELSQGPGLLEMVAGDEPEDPDHLVAQTSSSVIKFYPDWCRCLNCLTRNDHGRSRITFKDHFCDLFQCPPRGTLGRLLVVIFIFLSVWGFLFYLLRPLSENLKTNKSIEPDHTHNPAWAKGPIFALMIVEVTGLLTGVLLKRFFNFPALLGPLVLGIIYNNVAEINVFHLMKGYDYRNCIVGDMMCDRNAKHTINSWVKPIRMIALGIILTRAGIELSPKQLKKLKGIVPLLAFGPCLAEACVCAGLNFLFFNIMEDKEVNKMSLAMCFVGGFALAAVSPAVVVPGALSLKRTGYGVEKGVPTLLIAASSIDDVLAISIYTIALGLAVTAKHVEKWQVYSGGCIGIIIGLIHGMVMGVVLHFVPPQSSKNKPQYRIILLLLINFVSVLAYDDTWFSSAGSISVLVTSFIAGFGWRSQAHWKRPMHKIEKWLAHIWVLWVPLIFGTIGKEINFSGDAFESELLAKTFAVIFGSLMVRCITAYYLVSFGTGFNVKERIFIALSWIPKATVQAALAPLVLTRVIDAADSGMQDVMEYKALHKNATIVVNVAILAVLITAPLGCILMVLTGPKLLEKYETPHAIIEEEFPNGEGFDPAESTYGLVSPPLRMSFRLAGASSQDIRLLRSGSTTDDIGIQVNSSEKLNLPVHDSELKPNTTSNEPKLDTTNKDPKRNIVNDPKVNPRQQ